MSENTDAAKEWRELILKKIEHLEIGQGEIQRDISDIKIKSTSPETIERMQERIRQLESFKDKATTLFLVIQFLIGIAMMIVNHIWR